ncbi:MAG TPA: hypothetical protein VG889_20965 [Rhizomicrobium sp.]|nr:hypothetical protein [Rhizomicrobium sp.]
MIIRKAALAAISTAVLLAGCATEPLGPTVPVMPAQGKSMQAFQQDEDYCEQYAGDRAQGKVKQANDTELRNGVIGAALGAGLGALAGNTKGAVAGGLIGGAIGTTAGAGYDQHRVQRTYDVAYAQCMTARGNEVGMRRHPRRARYDYPPPPPPGDNYPPPPPPPGH